MIGTDLFMTILMGALGVAGLMSFIRLVRGPTLMDRIVAFDLAMMAVIGIIAANAVLTDQPLTLDAATILALVGFLATAAFAGYYVRRGRGGVP
jgi:multicomponent Na+:H+ antiporter subunit F